ncbi:hypothetical protein VOLCADRAFT_89106 [Volvox carteri f. nagariensis]|uniref:F-box domain-containing protein n=1 Tax=Volvox carteri f. nagariensis TaxID=3068 RepID=D8TQT7_VOLCA|nr:uncharacterized protein VOLCADRAFT_89106 [Volvox carteri f. nagariensis]EFJ50089.1 hypothetical protein VOLCADRAFT_89106 [Volvox carteri f. nagariensis]|eukprot:XP_002948709.1 hypothetical protein VOLCADRAFT_89106 [Volvox carteri f. nagariensis]
MIAGPHAGPSHGRHAKLSTAQAIGLPDLPKELVASIVSYLPYAALPAFRTTCKLARELVDAASNGWVMKVEEGEALLTSGLLQRLTSLVYVWFERWTWEDEQEANFLAVILMNLGVFARLQHCAALRSVAALSSLLELSLEGWALNDAGARILGQGLPQLQRLMLGNTGEVSREGYAALARLTGLLSLTAAAARGSNATLQPLAALTALTGLRIELAPGFADEDPGPLACLPALRTLGWWHAEPQPATGVRPCSVSPWLRELSLCMELDVRALSVLAECTGLNMMQVQSIRIPTSEDDPALIATAKWGTEAAVALAAAGSAASGATSRAVAQQAPALLPDGGCRGSGSSGVASVPLGGVRPHLLMPPCLPFLRTLILGELSMPAPGEPQPVVRLVELFPALENVLVFHVSGRGLQQLTGADRLKRLALNYPQLRDEVLEFLPPLPSLTGFQLEGCAQLTGAAVRALRSVPYLDQLLLLESPAVTDGFLWEAVAVLGALRTLVLSRLPNVHDEGLQALVSLAGSLEHLELRCMAGVTPAGLQVVTQLPRVTVLAVSECPGVGKAACRELAATLAAAGRDVNVEHETTTLAPVSLADEFGEPEEGAGDGAAGEGAVLG